MTAAYIAVADRARPGSGVSDRTAATLRVVRRTREERISASLRKGDAVADVQVSNQHMTDDGFRFDVTVDEAGRHTRHEVTLSHADYERWGSEGVSAAAVVRRCVEIMLRRVPQLKLLDRFDVREAVQLYPAFEMEMQRRFG